MRFDWENCTKVAYNFETFEVLSQNRPNAPFLSVKLSNNKGMNIKKANDCLFQTCLVRALVGYVEDRHNRPAVSYGLYLAASLFIVEMCRVLSYGASWAISYRLGIFAEYNKQNANLN